MKSIVIAGKSLVQCIFTKLFKCRKFLFSHKNLLLKNVKFDFEKNAKVHIGDYFSCRRNVQINVKNNAELDIANNVFINTNSVIACHDKIVIGNNVKFGPGTLIYDHDHVYKDGKITDQYATEEITIGNDVWLGANCIILKGTHIGNNCVFGAGCIIKGNYANESFVVQKRETTIKELNDFRPSK